MRCPDCNKFVSLEPNEPEVESLEITATGEITAEVRFVRVCAGCSIELKEATFEVEDQLPLDVMAKHKGSKHELSIAEKDCVIDESGGGRYTANVFTMELTYSVTCSCQENGAEPLHDGEFTAECKASHMDELV